MGIVSTNYHTAIATGAAANASVFNAPLGTLDTAITANTTSIAGLTTTVQTVLNSVILGGAAVTLTNGAASAAQKVVTVDSSAQFVAGCYVEYTLVGGVVERNVVDTVDSSTQITLITNIGTGGIADNSPVAVIPVGFYNSQAGVFNVLNYGASPSATGAVNAAAIQAAIDAAEAAGKGMVVLPAGAYALSTGLTLTSPNVNFVGYGATITCAAGQSFLTLGGSIYAGSVRGFTVVVSGGGHGIELSTCYLSNFEFRDLVTYTSGAGSGYYQPDGSTAANVGWYNCSFEADVDASASPFWVLDASGGSFNSCSLQNLWFQLNKNDNVPAISIVSATNNYLYGISMRDLVFEQNHGGAICLKGAWGATMENCLVYDLDVAISTTADMFEIGKHADGLASRGTTLINCGVIGNYTPGAFYGIDFTDGGLGSTLINCNATDAVDFNINFNYQPIVLINCNLPVVNASEWDIQLKPVEYAAKLPIKNDTGDPTAMEGMLYINKYDNKLRLYIDGAWRDVLAW